MASQLGSVPKKECTWRPLAPRWALGYRHCSQHPPHVLSLFVGFMNLPAFFPHPPSGETHTSQLPQGHWVQRHSFVIFSVVPLLRRKIQGTASGVVKGCPLSGGWGTEAQGEATLPVYPHPQVRQLSPLGVRQDLIIIHSGTLLTTFRLLRRRPPASHPVQSSKGELAGG